MTPADTLPALVLHIEDNPSNRKVVQHIFRATDYRLIEAVDGEEGGSEHEGDTHHRHHLLRSGRRRLQGAGGGLRRLHRQAVSPQRSPRTAG